MNPEDYERWAAWLAQGVEMLNEHAQQSFRWKPHHQKSAKDLMAFLETGLLRETQQQSSCLQDQPSSLALGLAGGTSLVPARSPTQQQKQQQKQKQKQKPPAQDELTALESDTHPAHPAQQQQQSSPQHKLQDRQELAAFLESGTRPSRPVQQSSSLALGLAGGTSLVPASSPTQQQHKLQDRQELAAFLESGTRPSRPVQQSSSLALGLAGGTSLVPASSPTQQQQQHAERHRKNKGIVHKEPPVKTTPWHANARILTRARLHALNTTMASIPHYSTTIVSTGIFGPTLVEIFAKKDAVIVAVDLETLCKQAMYADGYRGQDVSEIGISHVDLRECRDGHLAQKVAQTPGEPLQYSKQPVTTPGDRGIEYHKYIHSSHLIVSEYSDHNESTCIQPWHNTRPFGFAYGRSRFIAHSDVAAYVNRYFGNVRRQFRTKGEKARDLLRDVVLATWASTLEETTFAHMGIDVFQQQGVFAVDVQRHSTWARIHKGETACKQLGIMTWTGRGLDLGHNAGNDAANTLQKLIALAHLTQTQQKTVENGGALPYIKPSWVYSTFEVNQALGPRISSAILDHKTDVRKDVLEGVLPNIPVGRAVVANEADFVEDGAGVGSFPSSSHDVPDAHAQTHKDSLVKLPPKQLPEGVGSFPSSEVREESQAGTYDHHALAKLPSKQLPEGVGSFPSSEVREGSSSITGTETIRFRLPPAGKGKYSWIPTRWRAKDEGLGGCWVEMRREEFETEKRVHPKLASYFDQYASEMKMEEGGAAYNYDGCDSDDDSDDENPIRNVAVANRA